MQCTAFMVIYVVLIWYWVATGGTSYSQMTTEMQFYVMGALCFIVRAMLLYRTWKVMQNFNRGLRMYFDSGSVIHSNTTSSSSNSTKLLESVDTKPDEQNTIGIAGVTIDDAASNMSSRSRLNSSDFD